MKSLLAESNWEEIARWRPSVLALISANVLPVLGVLFFGWSTLALVAVYWAENVIIGMINVLKMIICAPRQDALDLPETDPAQLNGNSKQVQELSASQSRNIRAVHQGSKFFFIPFFICHYGMFCMVHGVFVFELLGGRGNMPAGPFDAWPYFWERLKGEGLLWAVGALAASHLFSFFRNYIYHGEFRRVTVLQLMFRPYGRIVIMHLAILFGAMLIQFLGSPVWMLAILAVGKTILDVGLHLAEREKSDGDTQPELDLQAESAK